MTKTKTKIKHEYHITIWLDEELYDRLEEYSQRHMITKSVVGRQAIRKVLDE